MLATYTSEIEQIVQSVFSTMLNLDTVRVETFPPPEEGLLLASIHIAGEWTGSVVLGLSPEVAVRSAAAMLLAPADEVTDADRREVASELVNMVGGNLKSVLPGPSFLSLPTILSGSDCGLEIHDAELVDDLTLACEAGLLRAQLFVRRPDAEGAHTA